MAWIRVMLAVALTVTAVLLQLTVLPLLHLPGAVPNVVAVTVIAIGLVAGSVRGAIVGFVAGMLIDLAPPSIATLGITALVWQGRSWAESSAIRTSPGLGCRGF